MASLSEYLSESLSTSFETRYAKQEVLERERSLPLGLYTKSKKVVVTYAPFPKITSEVIRQGNSSPIVFWTNDEGSMYKIGYPDEKVLDCNYYLNPQDSETDKDGPIYYSYACFNHSKMVYSTNLTETYIDSFDFTVKTPPYTSRPYHYEHMIHVVGREMNSFNMCLSSRLVKHLENSIRDWTNAKGVPFISTNATQLISVPLKNTPESEVKIQMCVHPNYLYWVVETLIQNYTRLSAHGINRFKFLYLVGEFLLYRITEVYPDAEVGKGIDTYGDYRREVLNPPNVVFYLKNNADIKSIADTLCCLFPERYDVTFGVPRFNMRLNRNVYISFEGHNERKYDLNQLFTPKEYQRILETKNQDYNELSHKFSGHTLMLPDGSENNIQSYKKLIKGDSFEEIYALHGLIDYYHEVFGKFNQEFEKLENALKSKRRTRFKSWAKSMTAKSMTAKSKANASNNKNKSRFKSWVKSMTAKSMTRSVSNANANANTKPNAKPNANATAKPNANANANAKPNANAKAKSNAIPKAKKEPKLGYKV